MTPLKKILIIILGTQISFTLFLICLVSFRFILNIPDWDQLRIWVIITYFLLSIGVFWIFRNKAFFAYAHLLISMVIIGASFYEGDPSPKNQFSFEWTSPKNMLHLPFSVDNLGRVYIEAKVNGTSGLFLFDTGSDLCIVNEALIKNPVETSKLHTLTDAQGISQTKKQVIIDSFQVTNIVCKEVLFWPTDSASWGRKGIFKGQKEVLGIIGNTFLTNFVWDFDMPNRVATLTRSIHNLKEVKKGTVLPLQYLDNHWMLPVAINGEEKFVTLDFGYASTLQVTDHVADDHKIMYGSGIGVHETGFAHTLTDSTQKDSIYYFQAKSISLGDQSFDNIFCYEKAYSSLLGIPFIWAFERVILDYPNEEIYLINRQALPGKFDVRTVSVQFHQKVKTPDIPAEPNGYFNRHVKYYADHVAPTLSENQDTVMEKFRIYGSVRYWGRNLQDVDSMQCMDSVLLPNGKIQHAPYTIHSRKINIY